MPSLDAGSDDDQLLQWRMLPQPTLTFTLPSLYDRTTLDCRVYHPQSLSPSPKSLRWRKHAAIIAPPYAPLGGCYDDAIVDIVATTLLRLGFLVAAFNFRGASGSAGRTSWTAKPEQADYSSLVGFLAYYVHYLDPFHDASPQAQPEEQHSDIAIDNSANSGQPLLLLGGYSYGAMITTQLPSLPTILASFESPSSGSAAAEIRLRAEHLAETQNTVLRSASMAAVDRSGHRSPRETPGLRVGGDEENRMSHDSRRSFSLENHEDKIRKGVAELRASWKAKRAAHRPSSGKTDDTVTQALIAPGKAADASDDAVHLPAVANFTQFRPAYLLVSPLQGIITSLATMSFSSSPKGHGGLGRRRSKGKEHHGASAAEAEDKLVHNPTLAIYGDKDIFVAVKKLRDWARRLEAMPASRYRAHEVSTAGHFWVEERVAYIMREAVKSFAEPLLHDNVSRTGS